MVKHIIIWKIKEEFDEDRKNEIKLGVKNGLEGLAGQIPGLVEIKVQTKVLPSSNADLMLDSTFESFEALKGYAVHPAHVDVADNLVRPYMASRSCVDFELEMSDTDFFLDKAETCYLNEDMNETVLWCEDALNADANNIDALVLKAKSVGWLSTLKEMYIMDGVDCLNQAIELTEGAEAKEKLAEKIYWEIKKQISSLLDRASHLNSQSKVYVNACLNQWKLVLASINCLSAEIVEQETGEMNSWSAK